MTTVSVTSPFQVVHDATVHGPGQTVDVPPEIADKWIDAGWVSDAKPERGATKTAPPEKAR
jgi:hypothetical protein